MLSLILTTFNNWPLTENCLESLLRCCEVTRRIVVVENQSRDETRARLPAYVSRFRERGIELIIHESEKNLGFANGMNRGLDILREKGLTDYIAVVNNDTILMPGWDRLLIEALRREKADVVSPFVIEEPFDTGTPARLLALAKRNRGRKRVQWSMILGLFTRQVIEEIGLFDPEYFVTYEDADLKHRMDLAGKRYFTVGDAVIWHKSKGSREGNRSLEEYGLSVFRKKWGFDPDANDHTPLAKLRRSWRKWEMKRDYL